jgi:hypothetical protein
VRRTLVVFVKWPEAGGVKTRLAVDLGPELAAAVYRRLAEVEIAATRPGAGDYERLVFFAPAEARAQVAAWLPGEALVEQQGVDLGARMSGAFEHAFAAGADQVAIVGTDVPWVDRAAVLRAFDCLDDADVAIGPSDDGGYYLLALKRPHPGLFAEVPWSTPGVLQATLDRVRALALRSVLLGPLPDVDTLADLRQAWDELAPLLPRDLATRLEPRLR